MEHNEGVKKAKEKLEKISNDPLMQRIADWKEKYVIEMNTTKIDGYNEGHKEGFEAGHEQGKKQGEINKEKEIAKKLKERNLTLKEISEITGLSIDEIKKL